MATFPALRPSSRAYDFGRFALSEVPSPSAGTIRFLHSDYANSIQLKLGFDVLTSAQASLIRAHYVEQSGSFLSFYLPPQVWAEHTFSANIAPIGTLWTYASPPEEEHLPNGFYSIEVQLLSDDSPSIAPKSLTLSLTAGAATGS